MWRHPGVTIQASLRGNWSELHNIVNIPPLVYVLTVLLSQSNNTVEVQINEMEIMVFAFPLKAVSEDNPQNVLVEIMTS